MIADPIAPRGSAVSRSAKILSTLFLTAALAAGLLAASPLAAGEPGEDSRFEELTGTWRGSGTIYSKDGDQDPIDCTASYRSSDKGKKLTQELECDSKPFDIALRSRLSHNAGELAGSWFEKKREVSGRAEGRMDTQTISLRLNTGGFAATLKASLSTCAQAIEFIPEDSGVTRVAVELKRDAC